MPSFISRVLKADEKVYISYEYFTGFQIRVEHLNYFHDLRLRVILYKIEDVD